MTAGDDNGNDRDQRGDIYPEYSGKGPSDTRRGPSRGASESVIQDFRDAMLRELDQIHRKIEDGHMKMNDIIAMMAENRVQASLFKPEAYVRKEEFQPIARIVWTTATLVFGGIITAVGAFAVKHLALVGVATAGVAVIIDKAF